MDSNSECVQFDIKHEEDPLSFNETQSQSQDIKCEIKTEAEQSDKNDEDIGVKCESEDIGCMKIIPKVERAQSLDIFFEESDEKSKDEQKFPEEDKTNVPLAYTTFETNGTDLQDNTCNVNVRHNTVVKEFSCNGGNNSSLDKNCPSNCIQNADKFSPNTSYTENKYVHTGEKLFTCEFCSKSFKQKSLLVNHICTHKEKPFTCNISNRSLFKHPSLIHKRMHIPQRTFSCNFCNKSYRKSDCKRHLHFGKTFSNQFSGECSPSENSHIETNDNPCNSTNENSVTCSVCSKTFSNKYNLNIHFRIHSNYKLFTCYICDKSFSRIFNYNRHMYTHSGDKPFTCDFCNRSFSQKCHLVDHVRSHAKEKLFTCTICSKKFSKKFNLTQHISLHNNEKPFKCELCNKSFNRSADCNKHMNNVHSGNKPFTCDYCSKAFSQKYRLAEHILVHTKTNPYICNVCDKCFKYKSNLRKHAVNHVDHTLFTCKICSKSFSQQSELEDHICT